MSDLNSVQLYGRVVRDAELRKSQNNLSYALFSIATNYSKKNANGEWEQKADFFPLSIYGNYAESMAPKLIKGQKIIIEGSLHQNKWEKDGVKHSNTIISVRNILLIFDKKKNEDNIPVESSSKAEEIKGLEFTEDQLADMYAEETEKLGEEGIF